MPWLAASSSARRRHRQPDLPEQLALRRARRRRRLDDGRRHGPDPDLDEPDDRRHRVDDRGDDRGEAGRLEQGEGRDQVDEGGHRLGGVEDRPEDRPEAIVRAVWTPIAIPMMSVSSVPTRTFASVTIEWSQRPSRTIRAEADRGDDRRPAGPTGTTRSRRRRPTTSHHGDDVRTLSSGLRTRFVSDVLDRDVIAPENVSVNQSTNALTGPGTRTRSRRETCVASTTNGAASRRRGSASGAPIRDPAPPPARIWVRTRARIEPLARGVRQPVEDDGQDDDREARRRTRRRRRPAAARAQDAPAEPGRPDQRR